MQTRGPRHIDTADCAKLVRKALKEHFPGVKFSVRTDRYSMGSSVDVRWTDGPTAAMVEARVKRFGGADFDGMIDLKTHHDSELDGETVSFGADWICCSRDYSDAFMVRIGERVAAKIGVEPPVWTSYRGGGLYLAACEHNDSRLPYLPDRADSLRDQVMQALAKTATQAK
jgi:hypothetical protein